MSRYAFMVEREIEVEAESEDEARDFALDILDESGCGGFDVYLSWYEEDDEDEDE